MIRRPAIALGLSCILCANTAFAGPPLITDDPDTPGPNHWEIDIAATSEYSGHAWHLQTPLLDNNYGVGDHIELTYEISWNVLAPDGENARGGLGDSLFGVKWRFLDQTNAWLDLSTYPQVEFNNLETSVHRGLVDDGTSFILPFEAGHHFGPLHVYAEPGIVWNVHREPEHFLGVAAEYELSEKTTLMAELYDDFARNFSGDELLFNLGFQQALTGHIAVIGSAGRAIFGPSDSAPRFMSYLALQLTF